MKRMREIRRLNLSLFLSSPLHREAWELLQSLPAGQRTEYVCRAVCRMQDQRAVLDAVRDVLSDKTAAVPQTHPHHEKQDGQSEQAGDISQDVLDFLNMLQNGDDVN